MMARIKTIACVTSSLFLFVLMMITVFDVIGRNFLNHPLPGASELTEILLPCIVFLLLPQIALEQKHITVELIDSISGPVLRFLQSTLAALSGVILFGLIAWQMWMLGNRAAGYGDVTTMLEIPLAPVLYLIAILSGASAVAFLVLLLRPGRVGAAHTPVEEAKSVGI